MAKTGYIALTTLQEDQYYSALQSGDRFIAPRVRRKVDLMSFRRKKGVSQKSLLPICSAVWATYTDAQKLSWKTAAAFCNMTNWRAFVRDKCYRVVNDLPGEASPNNYHQGLVGELRIEAPADELKIFQPHPSSYYISKKVTGTKSQYEPVVVNERLILPLQIGLSYKSDLEITEAGGYAKFYAIVRRLYQGNNIDTVLEIDLDLQTDWKSATATLSAILGQYTSYSLYFHLYKVRGILLVDNIISKHGNVYWARDPSCQDIHQDFTRAFYQVPAHWSALIIPDGSFFESVYPI
jgi:hypothetical protein